MSNRKADDGLAAAQLDVAYFKRSLAFQFCVFSLKLSCLLQLINLFLFVMVITEFPLFTHEVFLFHFIDIQDGQVVMKMWSPKYQNVLLWQNCGMLTNFKNIFVVNIHYRILMRNCSLSPKIIFEILSIEFFSYFKAEEQANAEEIDE